MIVISSQRHLNYNIVDEKIEKINGSQKVTLPVVYAGEFEGEALYVLVDGHHTGAAAKELGIEIEYSIEDADKLGYNSEWSLDEMLENLYMDSDWYNYETETTIF